MIGFGHAYQPHLLMSESCQIMLARCIGRVWLWVQTTSISIGPTPLSCTEQQSILKAYIHVIIVYRGGGLIMQGRTLSTL